MEWLNLHSSVLDSPEFVGSTPTQRSTWLCLLRFCIGQENGGVIQDSLTWSDTKWQQLTRVKRRDVTQKNCDLWIWHGSDLHVFKYPVDEEGKVLKNRKNGRLGGRPPKTQQETKPQTESQTEQKPYGYPDAKPSGYISRKRKDKDKDKDKEMVRKGEPLSPKSPPVVPDYDTSPSEPRPHSLVDVVAYFASQKAPQVEAEKFFDHFTSNGWRVGGKTAMRDWRAAARTWIRRWRNPPDYAGGNSAPKPPPAPFDPSAPHAHTGGLPDLSLPGNAPENLQPSEKP